MFKNFNIKPIHIPINLDISMNIPTIKIKGISLNLKNLKKDLFFLIGISIPLVKKVIMKIKNIDFGSCIIVKLEITTTNV